MLISVGRKGDNTTFKPREVTKDELLNIIVSIPYSPSVYQKDYRKKENFLAAEMIGLDIDSNMTIEEAKKIFNDYSYIIAPSKSHQKIKYKGKNKIELPPCDRFRILLPLEKPITNIDIFYNTWHFLQSLAPTIDPQCKDPSRYFYPSKEILHINKGKKVKPVLRPLLAPITRVDDGDVEKGKLSSKTARFLLLGAKDGFKHGRLQKAAIDSHEQGFSKEWFLKRVDELVERTGEEAYRNDSALKTIEDMFSKTPKYEPRQDNKSFKINKIADIIKNKVEIKWTVDKLLSQSGVSIMAGSPKIGKSTLVRQLIVSVLKGKEFLKRKVSKGKVIYLAFEEEEAIVNECFKKLGVLSSDELYVHVGSAMAESKNEDLIELLKEHRPNLVVIDTMGDFMDAQVNDYNELKKSLAELRKIARDENCHICLIHHSKKPFPGRDGKIKLMGGDGILGSQAIIGGVDSYMVIETDGSDDRYITSGGRQIDRWFQREIIFDNDKLIYRLGAKRSNSDYE